MIMCRDAKTLKLSKQICLTADCDRVVKTRDLCATCYVNARRMIAAGETTWVELESLGLSKVVETKHHNLFREAYFAAKKIKSRRRRAS